MSIGEAVRFFRKANTGLSMNALARAIGIDPGDLSRQETGVRRMNCDTLEKAAKFLGTTPSHLYAVAEGSEKRWLEVILNVTEISMRLGIMFNQAEKLELTEELLDMGQVELPSDNIVSAVIQRKTKS